MNNRVQVNSPQKKGQKVKTWTIMEDSFCYSERPYSGNFTPSRPKDLPIMMLGAKEIGRSFILELGQLDTD